MLYLPTYLSIRLSVYLACSGCAQVSFDLLQAIFKETKRPSREMQATIAAQLGLDATTVANFFMNARRRGVERFRDHAARYGAMHQHHHYPHPLPTQLAAYQPPPPVPMQAAFTPLHAWTRHDTMPPFAAFHSQHMQPGTSALMAELDFGAAYHQLPPSNTLLRQQAYNTACAYHEPHATFEQL